MPSIALSRQFCSPRNDIINSFDGFFLRSRLAGLNAGEEEGGGGKNWAVDAAEQMSNIVYLADYGRIDDHIASLLLIFCRAVSHFP